MATPEELARELALFDGTAHPWPAYRLGELADAAKKVAEWAHKRWCDSYNVIARVWTDDLRKQFGEPGSVHALSGDEIVSMLVYEVYGRASIRAVGTPVLPLYAAEGRSDPTLRTLFFENDYDGGGR